METNKVLQEALNKALSDAQTIVSDLKAAGATVIEIDAPSFGNHSGKVENPTLEDTALKQSLDLGVSNDSGQTAEQLAEQQTEADKTLQEQDKKDPVIPDEK